MRFKFKDVCSNFSVKYAQIHANVFNYLKYEVDKQMFHLSVKNPTMYIFWKDLFPFFVACYHIITQK